MTQSENHSIFYQILFKPPQKTTVVLTGNKRY
uniref:Uncharacterized protein n=1 Tax=Anguilla anguilla TaxID=7936 RepID=A0A0E9TZ25_ANGAN